MTDTELKRILQELAGIWSEGEPVVTLYLDTRFADEQSRERTRVFIRESAKAALDRHERHPQKEALRRTLDRVTAEAMARVEQPLSQVPKGLAVYACEALNLWRVIEVAMPFECALHVNARCHLLQLARLLDDVEPALVAVVHLRGARIYEVALGDVVNEATIEGPLPRSYKAAGYVPGPATGRQVLRSTDAGNLRAGGYQYERSQKNQRHYERIAERNRMAAASFLTQRFDQSPSHLVLVGPAHSVAAFERALPQRVRERIILRTPQPIPVVDGSPGARGAIVAKALEAVEKEERRSEQLAVDDAIGQARSGGLAVLGPEDVVLAVNQRRVHRLILEDDFERTGWLCRNCGAIGIEHVQRCSYCDGELAWVEALGEEIAGRVIADDGVVEVVPHTNKLHAYSGIAAMLRQAGQRGLGYAPQHAPRS